MADSQAWSEGSQLATQQFGDKREHKRNRQEQLQDEQRQQKLQVYADLHNQGRISPAELGHAIEDIYHDEEPEKKMSIFGRLLNRQKAKQQHDDYLQGKQKRATEEAGILGGAKSKEELAAAEQQRQLELEKAKHPPKAPAPVNESLNEFHKATIAVREAKEKLDEAKFEASQDPNNPATKQKLKQAAAEKEKADAYMMRAQASTTGTLNGQPLAGAMVDAEGKPVGSAFQANVRPTGAQREKATLATSARDQIADMRKILKTRGDLFGPGAGRVQKMQQWLGSQDPDAQRFTAAATTAADHLMGVFGGRSTWAGQRIEAAMGELKTNPEAAIAALDQFDKAAKLIQGVGSYKTVGGGNSSPTGNSPAPKKSPKEKKNAAGDTIVQGDDGKWRLKSASAAAN
jgi:hypothetical protein